MNDIGFYPHIHVFLLRITLAYGISLEDKLSFLHPEKYRTQVDPNDFCIGSRKHLPSDVRITISRYYC